MAGKAIQEYYAKKLLFPIFQRELDGKFGQTPDSLLLITELQDADAVRGEKLVVKPDVCIGKKGKNNLILAGANAQKAKEFLKKNYGAIVEVGGVKGKLDAFLVEPFVEHDKEFFAAVVSRADCDEILYSPQGGVDVEENWDSIRTAKVGLFEEPDAGKIGAQLQVQDALVQKFLAACVLAAREVGSPYLEFNPFTISQGKIFVLGTVARLDTHESFAKRKLWNGIPFKDAFGTTKTEQERKVEVLDESTSGSLKLTVFNKNAPLWLLVAGGGASVVFADTAADEGLAEKIGNYGEYSGNPTEQETFEYASLLFELVEQSNAPKKAVVIGGAIANFTDIAATLKGVCTAIEKHADALKKANARFFVRRGGPNYMQGLEEIRKTCAKNGIEAQVFGPEKPMTQMITLASEWIGGK